MEKVCKVCLIKKPLADFYAHPKMADGHLGKCKECQKASTARARAANPDYYREYDRERGKLPHRIANAIEQTKKWRDADKRRLKCHNSVARALRNGALEPMPCIVCGSEKTVAHHDDYDKPLDVIWLCQAHHKQLHAKGKS